MTYCKRLVLASASPRRRELLAKLGYEFEILVSDADERAEGPIESRVQELACQKARAVQPLAGDAWIVAADTLVALDGEALGKPKDEADAKRMLRALSARAHDVLTGVCLMDARTGAYLLRADRSIVRFFALTEAQIDGYVRTGEPMDKAGAYAIQGGAGAFVESLEGAYDNVMGFPTKLFTDMYAEFSSRI